MRILYQRKRKNDVLNQYQGRDPHEKHGNRKRLELARALATDPVVLLCDEPSLGLAPLLVDKLFAKIADIAMQNVTILLVEQKVGHALEIADRGYILETGRTVLSGTGKELRESEYVQRSYLGTE